MLEGKRPGGLTALAVLNFVFGSFDALGFAASVVMLATGFLPPAPEGERKAPSEDAGSVGADDAQRERAMRLGLKLGLLSGPLAGLLIASGVGYLKQKRVLGRHLGNAYAACSLGSTALALALVPRDLPGTGFTPLSLLAIIYPLVTLVLLNTTFRADFSE